MEILTIEQYHKRQREKYRKAINKWDYRKGGFPFCGAYFFSDEKGFRRKNGFVAVDGVRAIWRPTKIGVKRVYNKVVK